MKKLFLLLTLILVLGGTGQSAFNKFQLGYTLQTNANLRQENFFGLTGSSWASFTGSYTPGLGNPAVSTADYYHQDGIYWMRPYDLTAANCGATGASIAASRGRYVWISSVDHPSNYTWQNADGFRLGFSNDPGVPPATMEVFYPSTSITASAQSATITASISNGSGGAGNILNVTAVSGAVTYNNNATVSGAGMTSATITNILTGTAGGIGTYSISGAAQLISSQTMTLSQTNFKLYQAPFFYCNPDDASFPFYVSAEGQGSSIQHEQGYIKSADLVTWSSPLPSHITYTFGGLGSWSSFQRIVRDGAGSWHSTGLQVNYPSAPTTGGAGKWTSTDGLVWSPVGLFNTCIPSSSSTPNANSSSCTNGLLLKIGAAPDTTTIGAQAWSLGWLDTWASSQRNGQQWVGRAPIDGNYNALNSPSVVKVSAAYSGIYPGPTFLQNVNAYVEDGIAHYYAVIGYPPSDGIVGTVTAAPYMNSGACLATPDGQFSATASSSGTTLTVASGTVVVGGQISGGGFDRNTIITGPGSIGTVGGAGTYNISISQTVSSATIFGLTCGGLWQQGLDYYTEIADATAAAGAAPIGVSASCAASTATLTWFNALPTQTYRVYRGTTAGSQTTLVGDFAGTSATDTGMSLNAVTYYKVVYLNGGVEQKSRVVNTYCSTSSAFVNAHLTRAAANGADMTTCNRTVLDAVDNWLVSNSLSNNLLFGTMAQFCVAQNGSNQISKIFDIGTTRLPRGGDYTPTTTSTTYGATTINSKPAWVNGATNAFGYYGSGRLNNIRRKTQITFFSAYQKPGTGQVTPLGVGENSGIVLYHASGAPGTATFALTDATQTLSATSAFSGLATDFHSSAGTFDGTTLLAYADAVAGTGVTGLVIPSPNLNPPDALTGAVNPGAQGRFLGSGSQLSKHTGGNYVFSNNQAQFNGGANFVFDKALTAAQISSLHSLIKTTIYGL